MQQADVTTEPYILFRDDREDSRLVFDNPQEIVRCDDPQDFFEALARIEALRRSGKWLAGFMSYEAGYLFEEKLRPLLPAKRRMPLLCFGAFDAPHGNEHPLARPATTRSNEEFLTEPRAGWTLEQYRERFDRLHRHLALGDCYQANLTMPFDAAWKGDARAGFWSLIDRQPVRYGALIELGHPPIVSRSPELFFRVDEHGFIETHPMKGTAPRGATAGEDDAIKAAMLADEKTLAENRMIVDLLRNDISRITEVGTLHTPKLFEIETYPTVHQMVSHVRAKLLPDVTFGDIFAALFPCGSITGAPKMRAMEILRDLEEEARDIYCGAIGYVDPAGPMRFSVAIRTATLFAQGSAVFNAGGGIVFDSTADAEYDECLLKARFAVGDQWISR